MRTHGVGRWILVADCAWIAIAVLGADVLRYGIHGSTSAALTAHHLFLFLFVNWGLWFVLSLRMHLDGFHGGWRFSAMVSQLCLAVGLLMAGLFAAGYLVREYVSRLALTYFGGLLLVGLFLIRYGACIFLRGRHRGGHANRVVVAGNGHLANELVAKIKQHPEILCEVVGLLCPAETSIERYSAIGVNDATVSLSSLNIPEVLKQMRVDELILATGKLSMPEVLNLAARCREQGIDVSLVPYPYELYLSEPQFLDLDGLPVLRLQTTKPSGVYRRSKRVMDLALGIPLLAFAAAALAPALLMLRSRKGTAFLLEKRCGQHGKLFHMLRLNTEREGDNLSGLDRFLRHFSISELPQLWNVLRGEMSLVGPRPESPERVRHYSDWQQQRLSIKPGMTGLAQVNGLRERHSSEEKARFDLQYLLRPSLLVDLSLLLQTMWTIAGRMLHYPQFGSLAKSNYKRVDNEAGLLSSGEVLHGAHRSQSSAD